MKFQRYAFYNKEQGERKSEIKEVPVPMLMSMIILAVICLLLSVLAIPGVRETILSPATDILMDQMKYSSQIMGM
jgi:multicomponent Na+:H+ antiporter subunit D